MYAETGSDGKRRYTVDEIAGTFAVSRKTIYRHLDKNDAPAATGQEHAAAARHPARGQWRHLPCDHASGGRHGSGAGPPAAPAFRPHPCRAGLPCLRTQPASRPEALRQREDLAIVWLHQDSSSGPISQHRHCASCQPHVECGTVECAHRGDGPVLTGTLVDQLRKHGPNQPTALRAWLTSHGWQLEPEPLCPAHSNSIKD